MWRWRRKVACFVAIATALVALGSTLRSPSALYQDAPTIPGNSITTGDAFP